MGLRLKILLPLIFFASMLIVYLYGYWMPQSLANIETGSLRSIERHLDSVAEGLVPLLLGHQLDTAYENLDSLMKKNRDWIDIRLAAADGRTLYPLDVSPPAAAETRRGKDIHIVERRIQSLDTDLGSLILTVDFAPRLSDVRQRHWELMSFMLGMVFIFTATAGFVVDRLVRRPANLLARASQRLAEGDFDVPLIKAGDDEIGTLVDRFEDMRKAIREYRSTLQSAHDQLEAELQERRRAEETLHRLNRKLRAISNCNQTLMRAEDEQALLNDICRIVCNEAGFPMAWVGYAENDDARTIRPVAWAGAEDGYLEQAGLTWADTERGRGPAGTAVRSGQSAYIQDFTTDPQAAPWRDNALQRGYRSSIALPLKDESGNTFGILNIYAAKANAYTPDEIGLLEELSGDLAFGITVLRVRIERKRAEETLNQLNEELEQRVKERTAELEEKNAELGRLNRIFVGRELRMIELKERIRELETRLSGES